MHGSGGSNSVGCCVELLGCTAMVAASIAPKFYTL